MKTTQSHIGMFVALCLLASSGAAHATDNGMGDNICPQWTTLKCTKWAMGPPPKCTETGCVADKASDPARATLGNSGTVGGTRKHPILGGSMSKLKAKF